MQTSVTGWWLPFTCAGLPPAGYDKLPWRTEAEASLYEGYGVIVNAAESEMAWTRGAYMA